jgi:hypothetical protein
VFDNEMIAQTAWYKFRIGEISCPTKYFPDASSINFRRSCVYGLGVLKTTLDYRLSRWGLKRPTLFEPTSDSRLKSVMPAWAMPAVAGGCAEQQLAV